jgi:hypothetical protein
MVSILSVRAAGILLATLLIPTLLITVGQTVSQGLQRKDVLEQIAAFPDRYTGAHHGHALAIAGINPMDRVVFDVSTFAYFCQICRIDPQIAYTGRVTNVNLARAAIRDADLQMLTVFPELESLDLCDTPISDAALDIVQTLPNLQRLNLCHTAVSRKAIERLERARPNLLIAHTR